jgi:hypothetical protein
MKKSGTSSDPQPQQSVSGDQHSGMRYEQMDQKHATSQGNVQNVEYYDLLAVFSCHMIQVVGTVCIFFFSQAQQLKYPKAQSSTMHYRIMQNQQLG